MSMVNLPTRMAKQLNLEELAKMATPLQPIAEQAMPTYDRLADIVWWSGIEPNPVEQFLLAMPKLKVRYNKQQGEEMTFFKKIPVEIRRRIYGFVFEFPADGKQVNLSKDFTTKDVFPPDFFITPWELLRQVEGALSSCFQMRDEVYTYFWNTYHFHVTFSPYSTGPTFSGNSIKLLNSYAFRVNHLTVEVDMTKLAFSMAKDATLLNQSTKKLEKTLLNLVKGLDRRRSCGNTITSLTLLARRYQGFRPATAEAPEEKLPYCPDSALRIFDCFRELRPLVLQCRMSGFSIPHTRQLLRGILSKPYLTKFRPSPIIPAWPHYTPVPPEVAYLSSFNMTVDVSVKASGTPGSNESSRGSSEMPGFCPIIPSFGYSQTNSSAGSLVPTPNTGFYQLQGNPSTALLNQASNLTRNIPIAESLNLTLEGASDSPWTGPIGQWMEPISNQNDSPCVLQNTAGTMTVPRSGTYMTDKADMVTARENATLNSSRAGKVPFGKSIVITAPDSGILTPTRGTARSFTSRHGYNLNISGSPVSEENNFRSCGLGISVNTYKSPSVADEVNAEKNLHNQRAALPPRKDSLPYAAKSPSTIDELNQMNEMDPAFARAVEGLRMGSDQNEDGGGDNSGDNNGVGEASKPKKKVKNKDKNKKKKKGRKHWF